MNPLEIVGFIVLDPFEFPGGKVPRQVEQVFKALFCPNCLGGLLSDFDCPAVTPDNGRPDDRHLFVHADQPMHLLADTDSLDVGWIDS